MEQGRPEEARPMLEEAEALHRKHGDAGGVRRVRHLLGQQAAAVGDPDRGRRLLRESAELARKDRDLFGAASSFHSLGDIELDTGGIAAAENAYREALEIAWECGADRLVCYCLAGLAAVAAEQGRHEHAALLWGFAEAYEERLRFTLRWRSLYEARLESVAAAIPGQVEAGRRLDVDAAVELALGA
jgi:tetratricopeptide (TPR) repeat protein